MLTVSLCPVTTHCISTTNTQRYARETTYLSAGITKYPNYTVVIEISIPETQKATLTQ